MRDVVKITVKIIEIVDLRLVLQAVNYVAPVLVDRKIPKKNPDSSAINLTIARYEYLLRTKVLDFYNGKLK